MTITHLFIYPIKSLGGIALTEAVTQEKGLQYDRRFMLVTPQGECITQRTCPQMTLIEVAIVAPGGAPRLHVWHRHRPDEVLDLPLTPEPLTLVPLPVTIWDSENVPAVAVGEWADQWFTTALGQPCRLVFMPDTTHRDIEEGYVKPDSQGHLPAVSFADGYPFLLIGQASLDELNRRLPDPVGMSRFRPNIVVGGSVPNDEDGWYRFRIGPADFYGVKPCARCVLTTIDPATGRKGKEPLKTLATYRQYGHKILFGQNVLPAPGAPSAVVRVGQPIEVVERREPWLAAPAP
ncbi:MAG: MOSC domain-containing protein [Bacteroidetes bacterium]|nr:MOSC domain-containing protein [Fibrella sp.]